jgi:raffinose/stachyose/melibiose transport system substrate-binding protein
MELDRRRFMVGAGQLVVGATAASMLPACSSGSGTTPSPGAPSNETLTLWFDHPEWANVFQELVDGFQKQNPGVTIAVTEKSASTYSTALTAALATGSAPDLMSLAAGGTYASVAKAGHIKDLTGKLNLGNLNYAASAVSNVGSRVYGAPILGEYTIGIFYWLPTFAQYHLQPPTTWAEFTAVCETLLRHGVVPFQVPSQDGILPTFLWTTLLTTVRGASEIPKIAAGQTKITEPDYQAATDYLKSLTKYLSPGYASVALAAGQALFAENKAAMCIGGSADYTGFKQTNPDVKLGFFAVPAPPGMQPAVTSGVDSIFAINSSTSQKPAEAGVKFLNYFLTPAVQTQIAEKLELPSVKGVTTSDPMFKLIISQSANNGPVWFEPIQLSPMWNYSQQNIAKMLTGEISTTAFNQAAQRAIQSSA